MQARATRSASVNTTEWAKFFDFQLPPPEHKDFKQLSGMVEAAARFVRAMKAGDPPYWLSFLGTSGAGKTYLAKRIWKWFLRSSLCKADVDDDSKEFVYPGSWCNWPHLAGELINNRGYAVLEEMVPEKLVIIDEIGAERDATGHIRDCLSRLITQRTGKWTVITSNKSLGQIQRDIDTRMSSRMIRDGSVVVDVDVDDFNLRRP